MEISKISRRKKRKKACADYPPPPPNSNIGKYGVKIYEAPLREATNRVSRWFRVGVVLTGLAFAA